jgi:pimeloyl-ACP methyl ester carboxylesterase
MPIAAPIDVSVLPDGVRARIVPGVNGLAMHVLEAGESAQNRPALLLLHGFPELAFSWRKIMPILARAGFHVIAPDQRGYGRTTGWDPAYNGDVASFRMLNLVQDAVALVAAFGYRTVDAVVGHDFGSPVAAWCALIRPDIFRSVVMMSAPFAGTPPFDTSAAALAETRPDGGAMQRDLAALARPRKHYQWYYSTPQADADMTQCQQGLHDFLRAYYHVKSADWAGNRPFRLASWAAEELAKMPTYYIMDRDRTMPETVAPFMPTASEIAACAWLPEAELRVYSTEYARTGFQGGLQWYHCSTEPLLQADLGLFAGRTIGVPSCFIAGRQDWGVYQAPGAIERMQASACTRMMGCYLLEGAGHWVQQEQPHAAGELLLRFLAEKS